MNQKPSAPHQSHPLRDPAHDYHPITEVPGIQLNREQIARFAHRYLYGAELSRGRRVLEVACGAGSGAGLIRQSASHYVGLDYTGRLLHELHRHYGVRLPLAQGDAQQLPFVSAAFDLVLCFEAIYYLDDYRRFLAECRRVLTGAGRLLIVQSNPDWGDFVPGSMSHYYPRSPELIDSLTQAGLGAVQLLGALPTTRATPCQTWVNHLRQRVLRLARQRFSGRLAGVETAAMTALLKRLVYGRLVSLPGELTQAEAQAYAAGFSLTPLDPDRVDPIHRVHYFYAEVLR